MSQNPDPDLLTFSMQVRIAGRQVILRNALIGAAVSAAIASAAIYQYWMFIDAIAPLLGGTAIGLLGALIAFIGQFAAQRDSSTREFRQPINWAAVRYSALILAWLALIFCVFVDITIQERSEAFAFFITAAALVIGALIGGGLTLGVSTAMRALRGGAPKQMLTERQFDPLQHIESREHARR